MQAAFSTSSLAVEQEASDQDFLHLSLAQQGLTVRISPPADSVDASVPSARGHKANVLAVSNTFGWAVAATEPSGFVLFSLSSLHQLLSTAAAHSTPSLESQLAVPTPLPVDHLHFARSDHSLVVALRDGQVFVYSLKQLVQGQTTPQHTFPSVGGSLLSIHGCPAEFSPLVLLVATTPSPPRIINLTSPTASQTAFPPGLMATSACWSVKGKQISVGDVDGVVAQYTPEGQPKGSIPRPASLSAEYQVRAVEWLENTAWLITYALPTPEGQEPVHADEVFVVNKVGSGEYAHVKFFDPTPAFGLTQYEGKRWTLRLKSWAPFKHLLFLANKPSADLGAIAQFEEDGQWKGLVLPDASRPTLPMGENGDDVAPVGVALDLTGDAPSILVLTSRGVLVSWSVANSNAPQPYQGLVKAKDVTIESEPVAQDAGAATSSAPAAPTSSGFGAPSSSLSPFAVASTSSPSPFGPSAFGSSTFGSTPAFGQTPALGASAFGAAASGSSTPGVVSSGTNNAFAAFGSSSTSATGFAGFGSAANSSGFGAAAAATPATSNRGSIFGSGGAFKAAPAFGKSESTPSGSATPFAAAVTTNNALGSSTSSPNPFGSKASAAPATNAFGTSTLTPPFGSSTAAPAFGAPTAFGSSSAFGTATASPFGTESPSNAFSAFAGGSSSTNNAFGASTSGGSSGFGAFAAVKPANGGSIFGLGGALGSLTSSTPGGSSTTISAFGNGGSAFGAGGSAPAFGTGSFGGSPALTKAASTPKPSFGLRKDAFNSDDEDEDVDGVVDSGARVDEPPDLEPEHTGLDLNTSLKNAKSSSERVAEKASPRSAGSFGTASSGAFGMGSLGLGGSTTPAATTPTSEAKQPPVSGSASAASPGAMTSPTLPPTPTPKPAESPAASSSTPAAPVSFKSGFGGFGSTSSSTPQVGFGFGVGPSAPSIVTSTTPVPTTPALPKEDSDTQSAPTESKPVPTLAKTSVSNPSSAKNLFGFASSPPSTPSFSKSSGETEGNSLLSRLGGIEGDQDEEGEDEEYDEEAYDEEGEYEDEEEDDNEGEGEDEGEYAEEEVGGDEQEEDVQEDDEDGDQEQQDVEASSDAAEDEQAQGTSPPSPVPAKEDAKPAVKAADEPEPEAAPKAFAFSPASSPPSSTPTSVSGPKALPLAPTAPAPPAISDASSQQKSTPPTFSFHAPAPVPASKPSAPTAVSAPSPQGTTKPLLFSGGSFSGFGSSVPRVPSPLGAPQNSAPSAAPAFSFAQAPKQAATSEATKPALSFGGFGAPPEPTASTSPLPSPLPSSPASTSPLVFAAPSTPKAEPKPNFSFASMAPKESSKNAISFAPTAPKREVVKNPTFPFGAVAPSSSSPDPSVPAPQLQAAQRASVADLAPPPKLGSQLVKAAEPVVKEKGMAGELAKAYLRMQTDFEIVARNTVILGDFVKAIGKPCQVDASSSEVAEDLDPRHWSLGDLSKLRRALLDVQPGVGKLVEEAKKQKTQVAELQALMLKAETKSEEAARFIRAKDDPVFAKMVRVRQLGPEQLENQNRLRLAMTTIKATLEQVEDHVSVLREKMVESRLGRTSFKAPSLDSVNRAVRNISSAVAEKTFELDELTLRLELMRVQPASTTTLSRSARARSASITENAVNTSFLLRASPGASVKALSSPGTTQLRPDVFATAQAALRAERSCAILKRALLNVQGPVSRLNQTASEKASSNAHEDIADLQLAFSRGPITGDRLPLPRRKPERPKTPPPALAPVAPTIKTEPPSSALGLSMSSSSPFRTAGSQNLAAVPPPLTFKSAPQFSFATSTAARPSSPLNGASGGSGVSRGSKISSSRSSAVKLRPSESVAAPRSEGGAPVPKSSFDWNLPTAGSSNGSGANGPSASGDRKPIGFVPFAAAPLASKPFSAATSPPAEGDTGFLFDATASPNTDSPALSGAPSFSFAPPSKITSPAAGSAAPRHLAFKAFASVQDPKSLQLQHGDDEDDEEYDDEEGDEDEDYEDKQEGDGEEDEDGEWDEDEDDEEEGLDTIVEGDEE